MLRWTTPPMKSTARLLVTAALLGLAGCSSPMADFGGKDAARKYTVLNTDNFVVDAADQNAVSCTGLIEQRTASGNLKVTINIKSRETAPIRVQAQCMFRNAQDIVAEETPWQAFKLEPGDTETLSFVADSPDLKAYSVRVRLVH